MSKAKTGTRPWEKRAEELFEAEGPYADYAAWWEWLTGKLAEDGSPECLDECDEIDKATIYAIMCDLADGNGEDA